MAATCLNLNVLNSSGAEARISSMQYFISALVDLSLHLTASSLPSTASSLPSTASSLPSTA